MAFQQTGHLRFGTGDVGFDFFQFGLQLLQFIPSDALLAVERFQLALCLGKCGLAAGQRLLGARLSRLFLFEVGLRRADGLADILQIGGRLRCGVGVGAEAEQGGQQQGFDGIHTVLAIKAKGVAGL